MTRRPLELVVRVIGVGALLVALGLMLRPQAAPPSRSPYTLTSAALEDSSSRRVVNELATFIARSASDSLRPALAVTLSRIPDKSVRSALATARAAGVSVAWSDSTSAQGLVIAASAEIDPQGGTIVRARSNGQRPLLVRDDASLLDSIGRASDGLVVRGARLSGEAIAVQGTSRATTPIPHSATLRRVLLAARPGWEAKFVAAALEERGWQVDGSLVIAGRTSVTLGAPRAPDTSRYAAVVALDSGVMSAESLMRFARQGGGIVLSADALSAPSMASLRPASVVGVRAAVPGALLTDDPRLGLDAFELRPAARAVVLQRETRGAKSEPTVVAWRVGAGRVIASAYRETWRWRMEGTDDGIDEHRNWWSALVSAAAFVPSDTSSAGSVEFASRLPGNAAPYADLVAQLGTATARPPASVTTQDTPRRMWLLFVVATVALLAEWTFRRLRGAP